MKKRVLRSLFVSMMVYVLCGGVIVASDQAKITRHAVQETQKDTVNLSKTVKLYRIIEEGDLLKAEISHPVNITFTSFGEVTTKNTFNLGVEVLENGNYLVSIIPLSLIREKYFGLSVEKRLAINAGIEFEESSENLILSLEDIRKDSF